MCFKNRPVTVQYTERLQQIGAKKKVNVVVYPSLRKNVDFCGLNIPLIYIVHRLLHVFTIVLFQILTTRLDSALSGDALTPGKLRF